MQLVDFMALVDEYAQCVVTYKEERARSLRAQRTLDAYEFAKEARQVLESALLDLLPDNAAMRRGEAVAPDGTVMQQTED